MPRVAIVGAGLSGLVCAQTLNGRGFDVEVFEKSRGAGGRTSHRRAGPHLAFDHGAQYFTSRDPASARVVADWIDRGVVAEWSARIVRIGGAEVRPEVDGPRRYVGVPGMTAMARDLARDLTIRAETRISRAWRDDGHWRLADETGGAHGPFDRLVVALPSPQAALLLGAHPLAAEAVAVPMTPCWAGMVAFERPVEVPWDGAFVRESPLSWVARDSSKPGRDPSVDRWVLHGTAGWSEAHRDRAREDVAGLLVEAFAAIVPGPLPTTIHRDAHRWLFSASPNPLDRVVLSDEETGLAVCGDWLAGGRVEGAFRSGLAAGEGLRG